MMSLKTQEELRSKSTQLAELRALATGIIAVRAPSITILRRNDSKT